MPKSQNDDKDQVPQQVTEAGTPPKRTVATAKAAHAIYRQLKQDNEQLALKRAVIQGQLDGNPPYSKAELKQLGLTWMSNVNFRENWAVIRANVASTWDMFNNVPSVIRLEPKEPDPDRQILDYARIIEEEFDRMIRQNWPDYNYHMGLRLQEMFAFGYGPVFWEDDITWKSKAHKASALLVPGNSRNSVGALPFFCLRDELDAGELLKKIENEEAAKEAGWDVPYVKKVLIHRFKKGNAPPSSMTEEYLSSEWESTKQQIKNYDDTQGQQGFAKVRIIHLLAREKPDLEVSHSIIYEDETVEDTNKEPQFMFDKEKRFKSMMKAIHMMFFNIGEGYIKAARGLAHELYATGDISDRLTNEIINAAIVSSGLLVQATDASSRGAIPLHKKGFVTVVAEGLNALTSNYQPKLDAILAVRQMIDAIRNNSSGVFKKKLESPTQDARSATEVQLEHENEARFEGHQSSWYYSQWEAWLQETFERTVAPDYPDYVDGYTERNEFIDRCVKRGIPKEIITSEIWNVRVRKSIGLGSIREQRTLTQWAINNSPMLDEEGRRNVMSDAFGVRFGHEYTTRYVPTINRDMIPTRDHSTAQMESHFMMMGKQIQPGSDDPHRVHLIVHFQYAQQHIEGFQQQGDPAGAEQIVPMLALMIPHINGHIEHMRTDPTRKGEIGKWEEALAMVQEQFKQLEALMQQIQQLRAKQQQQQQQLVQDAEKQQQNNEFDKRFAEQEMRHKERMADVASLNEKRMVQLENTIAVMQRKMQADQAREDERMRREQDRKDREEQRKDRRES